MACTTMMAKAQLQGQLAATKTTTKLTSSKVTSLLPARTSALRRADRRASVMVRAAAETSGVEKFANDIGLPTDEPLFGFKPFPELWVGRLAMMGFITSIVEEAITGRGTLQQIGITAPDNTTLYALCGLFGAATLGGLASTLNKARNGKLTRRDLARYRAFLGMRDEARDIAETARAMKLTGDFTSPNDPAAIEAARAAGTPADAFLAPTDGSAVASASASLKADDGVFSVGRGDAQAADEAAAALKRAEAGEVGPSVSLAARDDIVESGTFTAADWRYAKQVELDNGRWAMLGFLAAILVEAATGNGILGQLVTALKWSGLLGAESGF